MNDRLSSSAAAPDALAAADALAVPRAVEAAAPGVEQVPVVDAVVAPLDGTQAADVAPLAVAADAVELADGTLAADALPPVVDAAVVLHEPWLADEAVAQHEPRVAGAAVAPHVPPQPADGMLPEHAVPQRQDARFALAPDAECSAPDALPVLHAVLAPDSPNARNSAHSSAVQAHGWCSRRYG